MSKHLPPIPPEAVSDKGPGGTDHLDPGNPPNRKDELHTRNVKEQGRQGNIAQNTHNQGYQQDR